MTFNDWYKVFTNKVKDYDFYTCRRALFDCHDTLKIWGDNINEDYAAKLWAEIDALRDRQMKLKGEAS